MTREAALQALTTAIRAEEEARAAIRHAMAEQARFLAELRMLGVPTTTVVHRIAAARGVALPVADRLRFAERMRKRARRGTRCPVDSGSPPGSISFAGSGSSQRALVPAQEEETSMAKLIKRTITEEFVDSRTLDGLEDAEPDADDLEGENGEEPDTEDERSERRRRR